MHIYIYIYIYIRVCVYIYIGAPGTFMNPLFLDPDGAVSKAFALTWYLALTWYSSPARPFAALDVPLLVTRQQGSPSPACRHSFPGLKMRALGAPANTIPS